MRLIIGANRPCSDDRSHCGQGHSLCRRAAMRIQEDFMRAWMIEQPGEADVMKLGKVDQLRPGPEEVRIEVHAIGINRADIRSEEHTTELQSRGHLVCSLLHAK